MTPEDKNEAGRERSVDEAARLLQNPPLPVRLPAESYTPIEAAHFNASTAALVICGTCGFIWNHPAPDSVESGEFTCDRCGAFDCGPLYYESGSDA